MKESQEFSMKILRPLIFVVVALAMLVWIVYRYTIGPINNYLDVHADNFTARFWNKKLVLAIIFFVSAVMFVSCIFGPIITFGYVFDLIENYQINRTLFAFELFGAVFGPFAALWSVHLMRHSSWHFVNHDDPISD